jgi:hypothetical protein
MSQGDTNDTRRKNKESYIVPAYKRPTLREAKDMLLSRFDQSKPEVQQMLRRIEELESKASQTTET